MTLRMANALFYVSDLEKTSMVTTAAISNTITTPFLVLVWAYVVYLVAQVTRIGFKQGGKYTSILPHFMAGAALLLLIQLVDAFFWFVVFGGVQPAQDIFTAFNVSLQLLRIGAGIFLLRGIYQLYTIEFATSGFTEV